MKNGAIVCNAGHFNVEIEVEQLNKYAINIRKEKHNIVGYQMKSNNWIYILAEGRLVNLAAGDGHPAEIMDMSFAIQALSAEYLVKTKGALSKNVIDVPDEIDNMVANRKLKYWGVEIDTLSED
jgi:adenosylhomocysteinase